VTRVSWAGAGENDSYPCRGIGRRKKKGERGLDSGRVEGTRKDRGVRHPSRVVKAMVKKNGGTAVKKKNHNNTENGIVLLSKKEGGGMGHLLL